NRVRITAQVIDAAKGYHLWSETYSRELQDVFAIQEEISNAIANTLRAKVPAWARRSARAFQPDAEAHSDFLRAQLLIHQQDIPRLYGSIEKVRQLIGRYPNYADPYAGVATAYAALSLAGVVPGRDVRLELQRNSEQAVHLDPNSAEAWTVMGGVSAHWNFD